MNFFYSMKKSWSILSYLNEAGTSIGSVMIFFSTYSGWNDFFSFTDIYDARMSPSQSSSIDGT